MASTLRPAAGPALLLAATVAAAAAAFMPAAALAADPSPAGQARALFDAYWEDVLREAPELATEVGDPRYNDRLSDLSPEAIARRTHSSERLVGQLEAIDPARLDDADRLSREALLYELRSHLRVQRLLGDLPLEASFGFGSVTPVTQLDGPQTGLPELVQSTPFATLRDYEDYLKRLAATPAHLQQLTAMLRAGMASGWMPPRVVLRNVPAQFDGVASADPAHNPLFAPFASIPAGIAEADRKRLAAAGAAAIRDHVAPAFAALREFYAGIYIPAARETIAASALPGGAPYYAAALQENNTTALGAEQIHKLGEQEVARIEGEMTAVQERAGFKGSRAEFHKHLWSDPKFFAASPAEMLAIYRDIAKRVDPQLPTMFRELPRLTYGIRAMPPEEGDNPEHCTPGSVDAGRAGWFEANTNNLKRVARWQMPVLVLHEAVPGHHLQLARSQEIPGLPAFRRFGFLPGYGEGWALYAESMGDAMGIYDDPYDKYGALTSDLLRAARLVVDTGIHAMGWSRDQALAYMHEHTTESEASIVSEVDRYIVWPGQATAYKIGQLRIMALRDRARAALGARFDLRDFHNAVLDGGAVPLDVLEAQIDRWIAARKAAPAVAHAAGGAASRAMSR